MGIYRITHPVFVMVKKGGSYLPDILPVGAIISVEEMNIDHNTYVNVSWNGNDALMSVRELRICAEPTSEDE